MNKKNSRKQKSIFPDKNTHLLFLSLLAASVMLIYARTGTFDFVLIDDNKLIYENPTVINPDIPYSECFTWSVGSVHYKPLVLLTWKLEYQLFGPNAGHFHTINWLFHLAGTLLLYFVMLRIFGRIYTDKRKTMYAAFFVALLFTVNPLRLESVAWATERKDVMFGFFFLLSWLMYISYLGNNNRIHLLAGAAFYLLSGLSKTMGITLFAVLFLTDLWFDRKITWKLLLDKIPFLIALLALLHLYGMVNLGIELPAHAENYTPDPDELNFENIATVSFLQGLPTLLQWIITTATKFMFWIGHSFVPINLSVHYSHNEIYNSLGKSMFLMPFIAAGLFVLGWLIRKKNASLLAGLLFFVVTLSPSLVLNAEGQGVFLSDRYTYIPSIGLFFVFVFSLSKLKQVKTANYLLYGFAGITFLISVLEVDNWRNTYNLSMQILKVNPNSGAAHLNLGKYYLENGRANDALNTYNRGIARQPGYYKLYVNRGRVLFDQGKLDQAIADFDKCLSLYPDYVVALTNRGASYGAQKKYDKALDDLNKALEISPDDSDALSNRAMLFIVTNQWAKAVPDYQAYLKKQSHDANALSALGHCYYRMERYREAITEYNRAIQLEPQNGVFYYNRSFPFNALGASQQALNDVRQAVALGVIVNASYIQQLESGVSAN